jgi:SET domain-containing protein
MARTRVPAVVVGESPMHGRGVFAARALKPGELVEVCPALIVPAKDDRHIEKTALRGYCFGWGDDASAFPLGFGALYNHSFTPNTEVELDFAEELIRYSAIRAIEPGEELTIDYTGAGAVDLWFDAVEL